MHVTGGLSEMRWSALSMEFEPGFPIFGTATFLSCNRVG